MTVVQALMTVMKDLPDGVLRSYTLKGALLMKLNSKGKVPMSSTLILGLKWSPTLKGALLVAVHSLGKLLMSSTLRFGFKWSSTLMVGY
jgi:hypothetical protein